jgi:hypothetical protein
MTMVGKFDNGNISLRPTFEASDCDQAEAA